MSLTYGEFKIYFDNTLRNAQISLAIWKKYIPNDERPYEAIWYFKSLTFKRLTFGSYDEFRYNKNKHDIFDIFTLEHMIDSVHDAAKNVSIHINHEDVDDYWKYACNNAASAIMWFGILVKAYIQGDINEMNRAQRNCKDNTERAVEYDKKQKMIDNKLNKINTTKTLGKRKSFRTMFDETFS